MKCVRVDRGDINNSVYEEAAQRIIAGKLVAFPTETVYGLGGDGLNKSAVCAIFDVKKRPANDPVILHVNSAPDAFDLWVLSPREKSLIEVLQERFWPGPLTIIAPAAENIPSEVTANTGRVAVRCPSHPVARRLIEKSGRPIAAPSANLYSRISPTRAEHVKKYFADQDLLIIECDDCCDIGIESTVISVEDSKIRILRAGGISLKDLQDALQQEHGDIRIETKELDSRITTAAAPLSTTTTSASSSCGDESGRRAELAAAAAATSSPDASSAPGQSLVHYAPTVTTYLCIDGAPRDRDLTESAIIDMSGIFSSLKSSARSYISIKEEGDPHSVARNLFSTLHQVEDAGGVKELLICISKEDLHRPEYAGVLDRSIRAAAHKIL